jgi:hypothetical protein
MIRVDRQHIFLIYTSYAVEGFGEATPPQMFLFSRSIGGEAADRAGKEEFFGGHSPSKPPIRAPTA